MTTLTWLARGRVGPRVASLMARHVAPDRVRVECANNPRFWMVLDTDTRQAQGEVKGSPGFFTVHKVGATMRVNAAACPWFWLELTPLPDQ